MKLCNPLINFLCLLGVAGFSLLANAEKQAVETEIQNEECHLNFGLADWPPLQYIDENGQANGFQINFVRAIANEIGCSLSFTVGNWNEIIAGVKEGSIDFVPDATKTPEREAFANFSIPYRRDSFAIYVRKKDQHLYENSDIASLKQMQFRLAINRNFLYGSEIEAWQSDQEYNPAIVYSDNTEQNFEKLKSEQIDGFVEDPYVMAYKFRSKKEKRVMTTLPISINAHTSCFMFSKKRISQDFIIKFDAALKKVKQQPAFKSSWFNL